MILIAADLGSTNNAYCVYDLKEGKVIEVEDITTNSKLYPTIESKIHEVYSRYLQLFNKYNPSVFIYEQFVGNGLVASNIYQVLGGIKLAAVTNNVKLTSYTAPEVKKKVTGKGTADKNDIAIAVNTYFKLELPYGKKEQSHKTDSLAVLLTYLLNNVQSRST